MIPDWMAWPETRTLIKAFAEAHVPLRFVGGSVRDALLSRKVTDVDAATPLKPEAVMALLENAHIKALPTGMAHGTVTAVINGKHFEITTLRRDVATDGRHAEVAYTDDWEADAARRDFTLNALYLSPSGELFDYFGGAEDAKAGRVRFIGDAGKRVAEDYLRILRFFRFYAHYGKTTPDAAALAACKNAAAHIAELSGERIQQEMLKLLAAAHPAPVISMMQQYGVAQQVFGGEANIATLMQVKAMETEIHSPPLPLVRLAALTNNIVWISDRLRLSNQDMARLKGAQTTIPADAPLAEQKKFLRKLGAETFIDSVMVSAARSGSIEPYKKMIHLPEQWQPPEFPVSGDDLIALGIKSGKEMGELLRRLEEEWESSDYKLTKEELLAQVK